MAGHGERLETLLGSCVSVLLTDPHHRVGVMSHIVYTRSTDPACTGNTRYARPALQAMYTLLLGQGFNPACCEAWVIGGGHLFPEHQRLMDVGAGNVGALRKLLHDKGIRIVGESVGGYCYRKVAWVIGNAAPEVQVEPVAVTGASHVASSYR